MIDHQARAEDVRWMADTGEGATRAAERLGITYDALEKWCRARGYVAEWRRLRAHDPHMPVDVREINRSNAARRWAS